MREKQGIETYTMKLRLYPSSAQAGKIEKIFHALHLAYNITFHEVFLQNPAVCRPPDANGCVWPDFRKMAQAAWKTNELTKRNPLISEAPASSLTTQNGLFLSDAKRAWEKGMHNLPVNKANRRDFHFYNRAHPRRSFLVQVPSKALCLSENNQTVAWLTLPKISGSIKARGFNRKLWFGPNGTHTFEEAAAAGELADTLTMRVSKDTCGAYYVSITFSAKANTARLLYIEHETRNSDAALGLDVGIKDVAILSDGTKYENKHFKKSRERTLQKMSRQLSRRWGPANAAYRDYNKYVRRENEKRPPELQQPPAFPSRGYLTIQKRRARLERRIARQRDTYYHQKTAEIVSRAGYLAVETLQVKNMIQNPKLAHALADAAMSDFLAKLRYKTARFGISLVEIDPFTPSSQRCSSCGAINPAVKNLSVRTWTCPVCKAHHDRDINAALNILHFALHPPEKKRPPPAEGKSKLPFQAVPRKPRSVPFPNEPQLIIQFSKTLTKFNDPRYVIINKETKVIVDDAQGAGYRSSTKAKNCYKQKRKWAAKTAHK